MAHEAFGLLVDVFGVDQNFTDVSRVVIANGADHEARFLINQERRFVCFGGTVNGGPQLQQVVQVPLQFFRGATDAGGTSDGAHAVWHFELRHGVAQFVTIFAFDTTRNAATARIVRHQNEIATR